MSGVFVAVGGVARGGGELDIAVVVAVDEATGMARAPSHFPDEAENAKKLDALNVDENGRFLEEPAERDPRVEKKRRAVQLERLGESLVKLKPGQLVRVPMPDDLRAAVLEAQRILIKGAFGGYRRQVQLIGKIMRTVDAVPVLAALEDLLSEGTMSSVAFQRAEQWREKLLKDGDEALALLVAEHGDVDRTALRQLVRAAQKERETQQTKPDVPSTNQKKLFRLLRLLFEPAQQPTDTVSDVSEEEP